MKGCSGMIATGKPCARGVMIRRQPRKMADGERKEESTPIDDRVGGMNP